MEIQKAMVNNVQTSQGGAKKSFSGQTHRQAQEYELISQYLSLKPGTSQFLDQQSEQNYKQADNSENKGSQTHSHSQTPSLPKKSCKKTSQFHNFQKHLMTTLKKCIKMKRTTNSDRSKTNIACQLWEYFLTNSKFCKRQLLCLLAGSIGKTEENHHSKNKQEYEKMLAYFSEYSEKEIKCAQQYLRREVIRQGHKLVESHSFESRRINKTDGFKNYFQIFISTLQEGKISLRLPKNAKNPQQVSNNGFELINQNV